jgi:hypothetical protein
MEGKRVVADATDAKKGEMEEVLAEPLAEG